MRINRYIARSGITSRRKAEELILSGKVSVDDKIITTLATEVDEKKSIVKIDGKIILLSKHIYYLFNKPVGYTTTKSDPYALHTIYELLPKNNSLFAVGRLDRNTAGLILITNDGNFAQNIIHPKMKIEKEYIIRTRFPITRDQLDLLEGGIELDDGFAKINSVKKINDKELSLIIEMGRNRIVRRLIKATGNEVSGLLRNRIGKIVLNIPVGKYRELTQKEVKDFI